MFQQPRPGNGVSFCLSSWGNQRFPRRRRNAALLVLPYGKPTPTTPAHAWYTLIFLCNFQCTISMQSIESRIARKTYSLTQVSIVKVWFLYFNSFNDLDLGNVFGRTLCPNLFGWSKFFVPLPKSLRFYSASPNFSTLRVSQLRCSLFRKIRSLERRWSSHTFRYGYLVTTSPQSPTLP